MRRLLALPLAVLLGLAACSSGSSGGGTTVAPTSTQALQKPTVSAPAVAPTTLVVTDLIKGTGPAAVAGDLLVMQYVGVRQANGEEYDNSYEKAEPFDFILGANSVIAGLDQGLVGVQRGGRRQLDVPASLAYGDTPPTSGPIVKGDALSFVVDVLDVLAPSTATDQPQVTIKRSGNISKAKVKDLVTGKGSLLVNGQHAVVQFTLYRADSGGQLTTSWGNVPATFHFGSAAGTYPGIIEAFQGMRIGGRRLAQLPYADMFNGAGNASLKLPAGVDVVMVVDLVDIY